MKIFVGKAQNALKPMPNPRVIVPHNVLVDIVRQTLDYPDDETGGGLWGLVTNGCDAVIRGAFHPVSDEINRQHAFLQVGGSHEADAIGWLMDNYARMKRETPNMVPEGTDLVYLFKWHSHHHLGVQSYSWTDITSIRGAVQTDHLSVAIGPLVNILENRHQVSNREIPAEERGVRVFEDLQRVQIKFYYYARWMADRGMHDPVLIAPYVVPDDHNLAMVPPLAWEFTRPEEFARTIRQLAAYGCEVNIAHRDIPGEPYLLIQLVVTKPGWKGTLSIMTHHDYPNTAPIFEIFAGGNSFPVKNTEEIWTCGMDLVEAVWNLERIGWL